MYTGLSESKFKTNLIKKSSKFTVLFRGKYNKEAGLETLAKASFILSSLPLRILIYSPGIPQNLAFAGNTTIYSEKINQKELVSVLKSSHLLLGQMSSHQRLSRTIPHKAFESAYLSQPYLTSNSVGVLELFKDGYEVLCHEAGDEFSLSEGIKFCYLNRSKISKIGKNMKIKYQGHSAQSVLSNYFIESILKSYISDNKKPKS